MSLCLVSFWCDRSRLSIIGVTWYVCVILCWCRLCVGEIVIGVIFIGCCDRLQRHQPHCNWLSLVLASLQVVSWFVVIVIATASTRALFEVGVIVIVVIVISGILLSL